MGRIARDLPGAVFETVLALGGIAYVWRPAEAGGFLALIGVGAFVLVVRIFTGRFGFTGFTILRWILRKK